ncbi:MAG: selenocysteine-specific translation elongation factor [Pseudomonadota bacterium]
MLIGTAGHIDHGKTTLVRALTGVDADRLPQEKQRGITLDLGYAYTPLPDGSVLGFVDVPGHEKLIRNMLAGATAIDYALLVIAADDGPMPQTREHLELLDLLGIQRGAVALTKCDAVPPERLEAVRGEIAHLLSGSGLAGCPLFEVSAPSGMGVAALHEHLQNAAADYTRPPAGSGFRLAIDRSFSLSGVGTVVTGTALSGKVRLGDTLTLSPPGLSARVRGLHVQDREAEQGTAGERCALALKGDFDKKDIERGMWLVGDGLAHPLNRFQVELHVPAGRKALKHMQSVHVHIGSDDIMGRVQLLEGKHLEPGGNMLAEILLKRDTLALRGDRFILRDAGASRTVAGGRVLDIFPPTRHKRTPERLALLQALRDDDPLTALATLREQSRMGIDLNRFALSWNLDDEQAQRLWERAQLRVIRDGGARIGIAMDAWQRLQERLLQLLAEEHERAPDMVGVEPGRLRRMIAVRLPQPLFKAVSDSLLAEGRIQLTRTWLHLPEHRVSVSEEDRQLFNELRHLLDAQPYNPPRVRDVHHKTGIPEYEVRRLFKRLARAGELYPVAHDHYFTAAALAELATIVQRLNMEQGAARAAPFRDILYLDGSGGRKLAIRILEFFDRIGYTRRVNDDHLLRKEGAEIPWQ